MKIVKFALAICFVMVSKETVIAGVDFYSGTGSPVSFNFSTDIGPWIPVSTASGAQVVRQEGGAANVKLDGAEGQGSEAGFELFMSATSSNSFSAKLSNAEEGFTYSLSDKVYQNTSSSADTVLSSSIVSIWDGTEAALGYSPQADNYFLWHATDNGTPIALGWALYEYDPASPESNSDQQFIIKSWAYNLAVSEGVKITVGDTALNNSGSEGEGQVPEPTGLAIFAIVSLGLASARRRSS